MIVTDRALGAFGVSIGTDNALEKVINVNDKKSKASTFNDFDNLHISLNTLIRNTIASLSSGDQATMVPTHIAKFTLDDIETIASLCEQAGIKLQLNAVTYDKLNKQYSIGSERIPSTTKQLFAKDYNDSCMKLLVEQVQEAIKHGLLGTATIVSCECTDAKHLCPVRTLYLTSYAVDLLEAKPDALLQSYKGEIVPKWEFWKLFSKNARLRERDFSRIPFNRLFIQIFGDSKSFFGRGYKELERIMDIADKYNWDQTTTKERIKMTLTTNNVWDDSYSKVEF